MSRTFSHPQAMPLSGGATLPLWPLAPFLLMDVLEQGSWYLGLLEGS